MELRTNQVVVSLAHDVGAENYGPFFRFWLAGQVGIYVLHTRIRIWMDGGGMGRWAVFYYLSVFSLLARNGELYVNLD